MLGAMLGCLFALRIAGFDFSSWWFIVIGIVYFIVSLIKMMYYTNSTEYFEKVVEYIKRVERKIDAM